MANTLIPTDVYQIVNATAQAMFGGDTTLQAVDTTSFVSVGETMLRHGYENTLNALSIVLGKTITAIRPYKGKYHSIYRTEDAFAGLTRKISYFYDNFEATQDWNTDINPENLKDGSSVDHYKIRKRYPLEMNFSGIKTLQKHYTRFRKQLKQAFRSEADFEAFFRGLGIEVGNELEQIKEVEGELMVLNRIAGNYYQANTIGNTRMAVNMTKAFNDAKGTTYTSEQLRREHLKDFLAFFVQTLGITGRMLERNTPLYHLTPTKTDEAGNELILLRHTPRSMQKFLVYAPFMLAAEAEVMPEIFHTDYLKIGGYELVDFWQDINDTAAVSITGHTTNKAGAGVSTGAVEIPYVLGLIYDQDALAINIKVEDVITTPVNAAADYYNIYYHWAKSYHDDYTENSVLFYMADEA